jgi:flavin reductase (DIM6/NTAB) family NADH-FMN oxidoreductase RutF
MTASLAQDRVEVSPAHWLEIARPTSALSLITTVDAAGSMNAAPFATLVRVSQDPLQLAFTAAEDSDTCANVRATGQFAVNLVPFEAELLKQVLVAAQPLPSGVDEIAQARLTAFTAIKITPPLLAQCYAHLELETEWIKPWSDRCMIVGSVVAVSARADCLNDGQELIWEKTQPVHFWGSKRGPSFSQMGAPVTVLPD